MLASLSIRDIVLIERLDLSLSAGLTALTGETGAGKSILLDAVSLALGVRMLRPDAVERYDLESRRADDRLRFAGPVEDDAQLADDGHRLAAVLVLPDGRRRPEDHR